MASHWIQGATDARPQDRVSDPYILLQVLTSFLYDFDQPALDEREAPSTLDCLGWSLGKLSYSARAAGEKTPLSS